MKTSVQSTKYDSTFRWLPWATVSAVSLLAITVWGQSISWQFDTLSPYTIFPVLGLLAFSIMWSHYMIGTLRRMLSPESDLKTYFEWTGYAVLILLLFHPGLLIYQRFRDGFGLPPGSYMDYVAPSMAWIVLLGSISLLAFLSFELKRWFDEKKWWKYILVVNDIAMLAVFYHGLKLGTQTHMDWFRYVWWFYGVTLFAVLANSYVTHIRQRSLDPL